MANFDSPCPELDDYFSKPAAPAADPEGWSDEPFHIDDDLRFDLGGYHPLTPSSVPEEPRSLFAPTPPAVATPPNLVERVKKHVGFEKAYPLGYREPLRSATPDPQQSSLIPSNPLFPSVTEAPKSFLENGLDRVTALLKVEI